MGCRPVKSFSFILIFVHGGSFRTYQRKICTMYFLFSQAEKNEFVSASVFQSRRKYFLFPKQNKMFDFVSVSENIFNFYFRKHTYLMGLFPQVKIF